MNGEPVRTTPPNGAMHAGRRARNERPARDAVRSSWSEWWSFSIEKRGPTWLQYAWTFVFNTAVAVVLSLIAWSFSQRAGIVQVFKWNFVISQAIGYSIHLLFEVAGRVMGHQRIAGFSTVQRVLFFAGIPIAGCLIGYWIGLTLLGVDVGRIVVGAPRVATGIILVSIVVSTFWYRYVAGKARLAEAEADRERQRSRAVQLERLALDAQLRSLQAQIEPHFLFNTLANVVSLIDGEPEKARLMLEKLIDLLRASLAASRSDRSTLGQEAALLRAYLEILQIRMGERLAYRIDIPPELAAVRLPALALQPLVENAIRHGLEPKLRGGSVTVAARLREDLVEIDVDDDGLGFGAEPGGGVGLANVRERLAVAYPDRASLQVHDLTPGTRVRLTLPRHES